MRMTTQVHWIQFPARSDVSDGYHSRSSRRLFSHESRRIGAIGCYVFLFAQAFYVQGSWFLVNALCTKKRRGSYRTCHVIPFTQPLCIIRVKAVYKWRFALKNR